jgi:hypothetical protein
MSWFSSIASSPFAQPGGFGVQQLVVGPGGQAFVQQQNFAVQVKCGSCGSFGHGRAQCPLLTVPQCGLCGQGHNTCDHQCKNCYTCGSHRTRYCPRLSRQPVGIVLGTPSSPVVVLGTPAQVHKYATGRRGGPHQPQLQLPTRQQVLIFRP